MPKLGGKGLAPLLLVRKNSKRIAAAAASKEQKSIKAKRIRTSQGKTLVKKTKRDPSVGLAAAAKRAAAWNRDARVVKFKPISCALLDNWEESEIANSEDEDDGENNGPKHSGNSQSVDNIESEAEETIQESIIVRTMKDVQGNFESESEDEGKNEF